MLFLDTQTEYIDGQCSFQTMVNDNICFILFFLVQGLSQESRFNFWVSNDFGRIFPHSQTFITVMHLFRGLSLLKPPTPNMLMDLYNTHCKYMMFCHIPLKKHFQLKWQLFRSVR